MSNRYHRRILSKGVEAWNKWRADNPGIEPDLSRARVGGMHLSGADLSEANLREADLRGAALSYANLNGANLRRANLSGCNLSNANVSRADLRGADLSGADLSRADLTTADLRNADLRGANLRLAALAAADGSSANVAGTKFDGAQFTSIDESVPGASVLDLVLADGIETASFESPEVLPWYVAKAFDYAHSERPEALLIPDFCSKALERIKLLRKICAEQEAPRKLVEVVHIISVELMKYLKKHPEALHQIKPRQFEELIAEILASYDWQVQLTPPTKDGGYDIFAISKDIEPGVTSSWIIECKKYAPENKVGVDIVRALYAIKSDLKVANALLATTSFFTKGAKDFKASRYDVELKDYEAILEWINEYRPNPNGRLYIKNNKLILPGEE